MSGQVIAAAIEVHRALGPGLMETAYEECLCRELSLQELKFKRQVPLPVLYKGVRLDFGYIQDIVVENCIVVELKAIEKVSDLHKAQLLTYLRLSDGWLGLLINFNVPVLRDGIERIVNGEPRP